MTSRSFRTMALRSGERRSKKSSTKSRAGVSSSLGNQEAEVQLGVAAMELGPLLLRERAEEGAGGAFGVGLQAMDGAADVSEPVFQARRLRHQLLRRLPGRRDARPHGL